MYRKQDYLLDQIRYSERIPVFLEVIKRTTMPRAHELSTDSALAHYYARWVLDGPFPAGEPAIAQDSHWAYWYALEVLRGPFPLGESVIARDPYYAFFYARDVLKKPWPRGEPAIAQDAKYQIAYHRAFPERREVLDV